MSLPPRQLSLRRLVEMGIRPDRELGQHFLIDDNLLGVIGRLAALDAQDVAFEAGAGLGLLTAYLADRVAHVHAVELDRRLEAALAASLEGRGNVTLVWADAMRLELGALSPAPTCFVANLPYGIAAPLLLRSIDALAECERWCCLIQREVADRLLAPPSTPAYGGPSVLSALAWEPAGRHAVSRSVFAPPPRVDSSLVAFRRRPGSPALTGDWPGITRTVAAAFSHRRKTVPNALSLAGWATREAAADACRAAGIDPGARAEELQPAAFVALAKLVP